MKRRDLVQVIEGGEAPVSRTMAELIDDMTAKAKAANPPLALLAYVGPDDQIVMLSAPSSEWTAKALVDGMFRLLFPPEAATDE
jgi:hypothetical protein